MTGLADVTKGDEEDGDGSRECFPSSSYVHSLPDRVAGKFSQIDRTLGSAAGTAGVAAHGNSLVVALDVLEELESTLELPAVDGLGSLAGVLERDTEVGAAGAGRLGGQNLGRSVTDLSTKKRPIDQLLSQQYVR